MFFVDPAEIGERGGEADREEKLTHLLVGKEIEEAVGENKAKGVPFNAHLVRETDPARSDRIGKKAGAGDHNGTDI